MAYTYIDEDGDEAVKFEHGKWDSLMGYKCPECGTYIGDPEEAMYHENNLPCQDDPDGYKDVYWKGGA